MGINRTSFCSLIVISCLIAGNNWQLVTDAKTINQSEYLTSLIVSHASVARKSPSKKTIQPDPLYGSCTEEEVDLMAVICYREARGEGIEGMKLVADVILNRVDSALFPTSITDVISQPGAFSTYREGDMEEPEITIDCYGAVLAEIQERTDSEILYFTAGGYSPYGEPAYKFGNHYFSK